jgi:hypothetical protein
VQAVQKRRLTGMHQGKVVARMRVLLGRYRLRELGHHRAKGLLLVEPMGKQMPPTNARRGVTWTTSAPEATGRGPSA